MIASWPVTRVFTRTVLRRVFARSSELLDLKKIKASMQVQLAAAAEDSDPAARETYTSDKSRSLRPPEEQPSRVLDSSEFEHDKRYHSMLRAMASSKSVFKFVEANKFKLKTTHLVTAMQRLITIHSIEKKRANLLLRQSAVKLSRASSTIGSPELKLIKDSLWKNSNFTSLVQLITDQLDRLNGEGLVNLARALRSDISCAALKAKLTFEFFRTVAEAEPSCWRRTTCF